MRTLKPRTLTVLNAPFQHEGKLRLVLVVGVMVSLDGTSIEQEQTIWKGLAGLPGGNGFLDEIKPKVRGEALLSGFAFAPQGKPAPIVPVRLTVGPPPSAPGAPLVDKEVWAVGDRWWKLTGPTEAVPFTEMPLGYDRAFGGDGYAQNPVGKGYATIKNEAGDAAQPLPNLEMAKKLVTSPRERPPIAGFAPIDPALPQRMKKVGTYDRRWLETRYPEMAEDFDPTYFNVAPEDQWIDGYWQGGESFVLQNVHRDKPRIEGTLPTFRARCLVTRRGATDGALDDVALRCDTIWFLPHEERVILLFRGGVDVVDEEASDIVDVIVGLERAGEPRPVEHYREVRRRRLDKDSGSLHSLREADLIPADLRIEKSNALREMDELVAREDLVRANQRRRAERELAAVRVRLEGLGVDPDKHVPKELPPEPKRPELHELADVVEGMKRDAEKHREEAVRKLRETCAQVGVDYDQKVAEAKKAGGGPPKFSAEEHFARTKDLIAKAKALGVDTSDKEARVEDPVFLEGLRKAETAVRDAYRRAAHHMPPAASMGEEQAAAVRREVEAALAAKESLAGRDLTGADLSGLDLSGRDLTGTLLENAKLAGCSFKGASVERAVFTRADLKGADFDGAKASGANFGAADLTGAKLTGGADLSEAIFIGATLDGADLTGATLDQAQLSEARCEKTILAGVRAVGLAVLKGSYRGVDLRGATIQKAVLLNVDLTGADLTGATFFRTSFVDATIEDACLRGIKLERVSFAKVEKGSSLARSDLRGADLRRVNLRGVNVEGADLREADLGGADLSGANLRDAKLEAVRAVGARFMKTDLTGADLARADLMRAMMGGALVGGASFEEANLFRADGAKMKGDDKTSFKGANLKQVRVIPDRNANG